MRKETGGAKKDNRTLVGKPNIHLKLALNIAKLYYYCMVSKGDLLDKLKYMK